MVDWSRFDPADFDLEIAEEKLAAHGVRDHEAVEVLWNGFIVRRNKRAAGGYQLIGRTDGGRVIKLIVLVKPGRILRVITGWPL